MRVIIGAWTWKFALLIPRKKVWIEIAIASVRHSLFEPQYERDVVDARTGVADVCHWNAKIMGPQVK